MEESRVRGEGGDLNLTDIYTSLEEAREEIQRRWNDQELKKRVNDFLGNDVPDFLRDEPKAYLARHIASPNFSFLHFIELAENLHLDWVCPEFLEDKFVSKNPDKYFLAKMFFLGEEGLWSSKKTGSFKIVDFSTFDGKPFKSVKTFWGQSFVEFHHQMIDKLGINSTGKIPDISRWLSGKGGSPDKFYPYLLSLFIRNAVLVENFLINGKEAEFTKKIFLTNFRKVEALFGLKPIIVRLFDQGTENENSWYYYSDRTKKMLE